MTTIDELLAVEYVAPRVDDSGPARPLFSHRDVVSFRSDSRRREIAGMVLPWHAAGESGGARWRFQPGTVELPEPLSRLKLLHSHDTSRAVGVAVDAAERADGMWAKFRIARTRAGDEVLAAAEDGVLDAFSVGPHIGRWRPDPFDRSVRLVEQASLVEVSLVALPAFEDARVESIAAQADLDARPVPAPVSVPGWEDVRRGFLLPHGAESYCSHTVRPDVGRVVAPAVRAVTHPSGVTLTVVDDRERVVREAAFEAVVHNVMGGVPIVAPWDFTPAEQGAFNAEVHRLRLEPGRQSAQRSLAAIESEVGRV